VQPNDVGASEIKLRAAQRIKFKPFVSDHRLLEQLQPSEFVYGMALQNPEQEPLMCFQLYADEYEEDNPLLYLV